MTMIYVVLRQIGLPELFKSKFCARVGKRRVRFISLLLDTYERPDAGDYLFTLLDSPPTNDLEFHLESIILFRIIIETFFSSRSSFLVNYEVCLIWPLFLPNFHFKAASRITVWIKRETVTEECFFLSNASEKSECKKGSLKTPFSTQMSKTITIRFYDYYERVFFPFLKFKIAFGWNSSFTCELFADLAIYSRILSISFQE